MKKYLTLFFLNIFFLTAFSQVRYLDSMFNFLKHSDIQYGSNFDNKNQLTSLLMDVYEPRNDTSTALRPIIFFMHGGSFVGGDRSDQNINKTSEFFAQKGYVTANIEYRVEQTNVISPFINFADPYNWYRAIARTTHDLKAAIRYIKKDVATNNNLYKVDTNTIFIYGSSAGAISMLHTVFLDDTSEMGFFFKAAYQDIGGGLDGNSGNPGYTIKGVKAVVSCSGAISDLNFVNNNRDIQYIGFHNNPDLTVPFDAGCFVTVACWLGQFYGGNRIFPKIKSAGTNAEFYPINELGHPVDVWSEPTRRNFILDKTTRFLYRILNPTIPTFIRNNKVKSFELFPNPTTGSFTIQIPKEIQYKDAVVNITDIAGKSVFYSEFKNNETLSLNIDLPNGIYAVSISTQEQNYLAKMHIIK